MTPDRPADRPYISVVVPVYNEVKRIAGTVGEMKDYLQSRRYTREIIGFVDADNKTPITEFDTVEPLLKSGNDIVIGSRGLRGSQIERAQPSYRRLGSNGFSLLMHTVVGLRDISDTQCGFKFFQRRPALDLFSPPRPSSATSLVSSEAAPPTPVGARAACLLTP